MKNSGGCVCLFGGFGVIITFIVTIIIRQIWFNFTGIILDFNNFSVIVMGGVLAIVISCILLFVLSIFSKMIKL